MACKRSMDLLLRWPIVEICQILLNTNNLNLNECEAPPRTSTTDHKALTVSTWNLNTGPMTCQSSALRREALRDRKSLDGDSEDSANDGVEADTRS